MKKNIPQLLDLIEKRICYFSDQAELDTMTDKQKETMISEMDIFATFVLDKARLCIERGYELKRQQAMFGDNGCEVHKSLMERMEKGLKEVEEFYANGMTENC